MRNLSIFLTTLMLAALLLTACGGEETNTAIPNTPIPQTTATSDNTMETETIEPSDMTTTPGIPVTGEEDPARISNQLDYDVWNQNGDQIGEVNDMILDLDNARIAYVIVGSGGFLEIGEKDVLVPWDSLQLQTAADNGPAGDSNAFVLQADPELFENAPDVDVNSTLPALGQAAGDWDLDIRNYWQNGVVPATAAPNATGTAVPEMTATTGSDSTAVSEGTAMAGTMELQGVALASDVLGAGAVLSPGQGNGDGIGEGQDQATLTPAAGQDQAKATAEAGQVPAEGVGNFSGTVDDLIIDINSGDILFVVVDTFFEDGERWIPIPLSAFQWDSNNGVWAINANPATVRDAPFFGDDQFPDTTADGWSSEFDTFWQNLK